MFKDMRDSIVNSKVIYLHPKERNASKQVHCRLEVHELLSAGGREVVPVHGEVDPKRVVKLIEQFDEFFFL